MKRLRFITACIATLLLMSCIREDVEDGLVCVGGNEVLASFDFHHEDYDEVTITTKATLGIVPESRVQNIYVYIFAGNNKVYSHYFDNLNLKTSPQVVQNAGVNCWYVSNRTAEGTSNKTHGTIKIKAPELTGGKIYLIANVNADMVNISPEKLNIIKTEDELKALAATLNQEITSRNGYFPMVASADGIAVDGKTGEVTCNSNADLNLHLKRMDAKVKVNLRVATDNELGVTEDGITTTQTLKEFVPQSWRVVNIPKGAYVVERNSEDCEASGYFDTEAVNFEEAGSMEFTYTNSSGVDITVTSPVNSFSFYMLENRESTNKKKSVDKDYHKRDLRLKNSAGEYDLSSGQMWEYAPENGTYLEIKGEVIMDVDVSNEAKTQQLVSAVTYYVHLGDVVHSETEHDAHDNYDVERNTYYTYTITIKGVNAIETEVVTSNDVREGTADKITESESGATGDVYIAKESVYTFDAHYGQRVFCFDAAYIDPNNVTWYVKTPFGKEGIPNKIGDTEVPSGLDYKWVHFLVNDISETEDAYTGTYPYSQNNMTWPGHPDDGFDSDAEKELWAKGKKVMDVVEFTKYIKEQKRLLDLKDDSNDFRKEFDQAWFDKFGAGKKETDDGVWHRSRIYVTVFIDEFYYEKDPMTGEVREGLWKEFVNQPNRLMHILCDNDISLDGESSATGSVITIRQRSIQTPFNITKPALMTAWGCETVDETSEGQLWFYPSAQENNPENKGNTSETNGLFNTAKLLGVSEDPGMKMADYVDYDRVNDYHNKDNVRSLFLKDEFISMLYSILMRNRDEDGDGYLEAGELKWYIASINQLYGLYMGSLGLNSEAMLYPASRAAMTGNYESGNFKGAAKWRSHIVSSTKDNTTYKTNKPLELWGEEGIAISYYKQYNNNKSAPYSIRCVRNLGLDASSFADLNSVEPEKLIKFDYDSDTKNYLFDLSNINDKSVRFYTTKELEPSDEHSEMSRIYYGFETGNSVATGQYPALKADLDAGKSPCPEGWRVPNVREGAMMALYCSSDWWNTGGQGDIIVSSYYSNGTLGNKNDTESPSWQFKYHHASIGEETATGTRCVRDYMPGEVN